MWGKCEGVAEGVCGVGVARRGFGELLEGDVRRVGAESEGDGVLCAAEV